MRFSAIQKLSSYLVVLSAVFSLLLSPDIPLLAIVLSLFGIALSWFAEAPRYRHERYILTWNIATAGFFFFQATDVVQGGSLINSGAYFLLFVLVNKLFNRRTSKDYQQAYVVSFLILVVATTLNTNISYAICFALFILFTTWGLTLLHLKREMEENYLLKHADGLTSEKVKVERILNSRRIVSKGFLAGTSLISIGILIGSAVIFTLFPRIGFGLFLGHKRGRVAMVGFSERVELGHHGVIRDNPQVVMRIFFPGGKPKGVLRFRGSVFDHYQGGIWSHSPELFGKMDRVLLKEGLYTINHAPGLPRPLVAPYIRNHLTRQEIYLEPLNSTVLFAADRPIALEVPRTKVGHTLFFEPRKGPFGELRGSKIRSTGVRYIAYSFLTSPSPKQLRQSRAIPTTIQPHLLQLPTSLPPRVGQLARRITRDQKTAYDKVLAIQRYLRRNYEYTLNLTHDKDKEPVDEFLFETKKGHCEYFASAMTLMLRHLGIHARNVNGFAGGAWNKMGNYLAVRQGDAHAWVEVLFDVGWVTFDPTPSGSPQHSAWGLFSKLSQYWDTIRLRWFQYVVEYDLGKQISLLQKARNILSPKSNSESWLSYIWRPLALLAALALIILAILYGHRYLKRKQKRPTEQSRSPLTLPSQLYQRLLKILDRAGHTKPPGITPLEFALTLKQASLPAAPLVEQFTRSYYDLRFGEVELTKERGQELSETLGQLKAQLQHPPKTEAPKAPDQLS